eukprot:Hpha_TRINITY_DN14697_c0_g1::TRINITY_DN14697_c0_g1_i1::g.48127::m.48127
MEEKVLLLCCCCTTTSVENELRGTVETVQWTSATKLLLNPMSLPPRGGTFRVCFWISNVSFEIQTLWVLLLGYFLLCTLPFSVTIQRTPPKPCCQVGVFNILLSPFALSI